MQATQTITLLSPEPTKPNAQIVKLIAEAEEVDNTKRSNLQTFIDRLKIICLQYIGNRDELSEDIQDAAEGFCEIDCSQIHQVSDIIQIAQNCKNLFAQILVNDFDHAELNEIEEVRGWKFEKWQLLDYINLDKYFGRRQVAISPFDNKPFPEKLPGHEFAQAIIDLLKTIPKLVQVSSPQESKEQNDLVIQNDSPIITFIVLENSNGSLNRDLTNIFTPQNDERNAFERYLTMKSLAKKSVQLKKCKEELTQLEIDIEARRLQRESHLHEIINREAQKLLEYFEERQQAVQARLDEAEKARTEIAELKEKLEKASSELKGLNEKLTAQEKRSDDLQRQIFVVQANYYRLAREIQELRERCRKKRRWWSFLGL